MSWAQIAIAIATSNLVIAQEPPLNPELRGRCLDILSSAIAGDEFWPAMHAAEALTLAGAKDKVVIALGGRLASERDDQRRCGLARELVRAGDRGRLSVLFGILSDERSNGRVHAAESLFQLGETGDGKQLRAAFAETHNSQLRLMSAAALAKAGDSSALSLLRDQLASGDRAQRSTSAFALARLGNESDLAPLATALNRETDAMARAILTSALAMLHNVAAREQLGRSLDSSDPAVRALAAEYVGAARCSEYQPRLVQLLNDSTVDVRVRAAQSLIALSLPAKR